MVGQKPAQALPGTYSEFQSSLLLGLRRDPHENLRRGDRARHRLADQLLDGLALVGRAEDATSVRGRTGELGGERVGRCAGHALQRDRERRRTDGAEASDVELASYYSPGLIRPPLSTMTSRVSVPLLALACQTPVLSRDRSTTSV